MSNGSLFTKWQWHHWQNFFLHQIYLWKGKFPPATFPASWEHYASMERNIFFSLKHGPNISINWLQVIDLLLNLYLSQNVSDQIETVTQISYSGFMVWSGSEVLELSTGRGWGDKCYPCFSLPPRHLHIATLEALVPVCKYIGTQRTQLTKHAIFMEEAQMDTALLWLYYKTLSSKQAGEWKVGLGVYNCISST